MDDLLIQMLGNLPTLAGLVVLIIVLIRRDEEAAKERRENDAYMRELLDDCLDRGLSSEQKIENFRSGFT